ncbi:MAG TPA: helix-turn-helix domain-containing protein [Anaerolinea sp.]|nr:helix-turn-helix domain-containing protein [Anaerolinea sp.]
MIDNGRPGPRRFEPLLTAEDVAEALKCSRSAAYRLLRSGALPVVRFGGLVRCRPADLQRFIEAGGDPGAAGDE